MTEVRVRNDELCTIREAMRGLTTFVDQLEAGRLEKLVLTQRNRMRAVVISAEKYSELQRELEELRGGPAALKPAA